MERILPPARGVSSIGSTVGDAVVPVAESPPNLPLQAALVNDLCSVQNGRNRLSCLLQEWGIVAQEQRRFEEAEAAYKKALEILLAFDDRHRAASNHGLGVVAEEQRRFEEAEAAYKKALEVFVAFHNAHDASVVLGSFARLWAETDAASIPSRKWITPRPPS
jgi:tetratricopeptide (TPR) repeat protein